MFGKVGIIVQARMSSTRLPGKSLLLIGNNPLIYYVFQRLSLTGLPVIVCTSTHPSDDSLVEYLESQKYKYFRGSLDNVLQRYIETATHFGIEEIIRVTGDNPLVDITELTRSLSLLRKYNYVDGIFSGGMIKGTGFELVKLSELMKIPSTKQDYLEHVTLWLRENLKRSEKRIQLEPTIKASNHKDIFLTCDYREDLELLRNIFSHFNYRYDIEIPVVLSFLDQKPWLKEVNNLLH